MIDFTTFLTYPYYISTKDSYYTCYYFFFFSNIYIYRLLTDYISITTNRSFSTSPSHGWFIVVLQTLVNLANYEIKKKNIWLKYYLWSSMISWLHDVHLQNLPHLTSATRVTLFSQRIPRAICRRGVSASRVLGRGWTCDFNP